MRPTAVALAASLFAAFPPVVSAKCVQIFYDAVPRAAERYWLGRTHAVFLQNLLGHFPEIQQYVVPIEKYRPGLLDRCETSFYLGTYFDNPVPASFLADFSRTARTVVWAGYNIWKLPEADQRRLLGARYDSVSVADWADLDAAGRPAFFREFEYKGQTFTKYGELDARGTFAAADELMVMTLEPGAQAGVRAWALHERTGERAPYVLAKKNRWYVADSPFSYATEEDRYLIFCDLLFDMLDEKPRRPASAKKLALFRLEDVHPNLPLWPLYAAADMLAREKVPFSLAMIPIWVDSVGAAKSRRRYIPIGEKPGFSEFVKYAAARGASFVYHGVTHEHGFGKNPFTGITGDDYEFWDRGREAPIEEDSEDFVVDRVADGLRLLTAAGAMPCAWMTPHYQASPLDYSLFAELFPWNVGRVVYWPYFFAGERGVGYPKKAPPQGQFFPFEVYGDVYGQRLIPEDMGNLQPYLNDQVVKPVAVEDLIRVMKRDAVIRDAWASFFIHPSMLDTMAKGGVAAKAGDTAPLERLIAAARENGYEFVDLKDWAARHLEPVRPQPVEVLP